MKLIDADKYCEFLNTYPLEKAQNFMSFYRDALQKTFEFEVEAIPIEWIEKYAKRTSKKCCHCATAIWEMLEDWEKENDKNSE